MKPLTKSKIRFWIILFLKIFKRDLIKPFTDKTSLFQIFFLLVGFTFIFREQGLSSFYLELVSFIKTIEILTYTILVYFVFCILSSTISAILQIRKTGRWFENKFVFHSPYLIETYQIKLDKTAFDQEIKVFEPNPNSKITLRVEKDLLPAQNYSVDFNTNKKHIDWGHGNTHEDVPLFNSRALMTIKDFSSTDNASKIATVRIYLLGWEAI